jgi:hypothetical protein
LNLRRPSQDEIVEIKPEKFQKKKKKAIYRPPLVVFKSKASILNAYDFENALYRNKDRIKETCITINSQERSGKWMPSSIRTDDVANRGNQITQGDLLNPDFITCSGKSAIISKPDSRQSSR